MDVHDTEKIYVGLLVYKESNGIFHKRGHIESI